MPTFGDYTPADTTGAFNNGLLAYSNLAINQAKADAAQQDLADRATLRAQAPAFASSDPTEAAQAQGVALSLPGVGGVGAAGGLASMHADQRAQLGNTLAVTGALSGAILAAPPDQRAALWTAFRPVAMQAGANNIPEQYPGDDAVAAHRAAALTAQQQIDVLNKGMTVDPTRTPLQAPTGARTMPGGVIAGSAGTDFMSRMQGSEDATGHAVNGGGYAGAFQFGAPRLADLGVYTPAPGEIADGKWNGQMNGSFHIPGFPDVKTKADFLANLPAQKAAFGVHVADIDAAIANTPGAATLNQDGLRAVAHLGGVDGMRKFVATGGKFNPADSNGVRLSDYYRKFAQGGPASSGASAPAPTTSGTPAAESPAIPNAAIATPPAATTTGAPTAVPTAAPVPVDANANAVTAPAPSPGGEIAATSPAGSAAAPDGAAAVLARLRAAQQAPAAPVPNENQLLSVAAPGVSPDWTSPDAFAARNALMPPDQAAPAGPAPVSPAPVSPAPAPSAARPAGPVAPVSNLAPAAAPTASTPAPVPQAPARPPAAPAVGAPAGQILYREGVPVPASVPGYVLARMPDGSVGMTHLPGSPEPVDIKDAGNVRSFYSKQTGALLRTETIDNKDRSILANVPGGQRVVQDGKLTGPVIPYSGRPEQNEAYKSDVPVAQAITTTAQAAQANMLRLNEMADIATQLATGPTADIRAKGAAWLESMGASPEKIKAWTGMSSGSLAQEFVKLSLTTAGAAARTDVGSNNGIQSTQLYVSANPGLALLPDANRRMTNMLRVIQQFSQDYAQGALQHFGTNESQFLQGGNYAPLTTFNRAWQAQNNPQVGAAVMGILNGDPFEKWSARISPAEGARAAAMAARIDPNVMVPVRGGKTRPAADILAHPAISGGGATAPTSAVP